MKVSLLAVAVILAACTTTKAPPGAVVSDTVTQLAPLDSTVQHKVAPDTLVRGDGQYCVVRPAGKYDAVELGKPFTACDWRVK